MKKNAITLLTLVMLVLFGALSGMAQDQPATPSQDQAAPAPAAPAQDQAAPAPAQDQTPAAPEAMAKPARSHAMHAMAKAETLSGTVVSADGNTVVVTGSDGVPYDFTVNKMTKVMSGGSKGSVSDLTAGKQVSVTFVDMRKKGDWAKSIEVTQ